jgi:hypothetical protein
MSLDRFLHIVVLEEQAWSHQDAETFIEHRVMQCTGYCIEVTYKRKIYAAIPTEIWVPIA